jgi:dephospho-CoA kinase
MHLFGLTGGIASGKSVVGARFAARGVPVIDADALAREVVAKGSPGLADLVSAFGSGILLPDGSLDRKGLATLAFADVAQKKKLDAITHPRISALTMERAAALAAKGEPLACYEAALIVENGMADAFRPLVVVAAPEDVQVARVLNRDGGSPADALLRIRAQKPTADKVKVADHVLESTGTIEELKRATDAVLYAICTKLSVDPARYPPAQF